MELKEKYTIEDLMEIMRILRGENGCPWDKVQTHQSIKKSLIEECYEAIDALDKEDWGAFANELGDVLLQVVFHSCIAEEKGEFKFDDVLYELCTKLITRHTHVFGGDSAASSEEALSNWEKNKKREKGLASFTEMIDDVPHGLPALMRAQKVQKKAASAGFDWENEDGVWDKLREEERELAGAQTEEKICEEMGDLLFTAVNLGRHKGVDCETALAAATAKFSGRFAAMEKLANGDGYALCDLPGEKLESYWGKIKQNTGKK